MRSSLWCSTCCALFFASSASSALLWERRTAGFDVRTWNQQTDETAIEKGRMVQFWRKAASGLFDDSSGVRDRRVDRRQWFDYEVSENNNENRAPHSRPQNHTDINQAVAMTTIAAINTTAAIIARDGKAQFTSTVHSSILCSQTGSVLRNASTLLVLTLTAFLRWFFAIVTSRSFCCRQNQRNRRSLNQAVRSTSYSLASGWRSFPEVLRRRWNGWWRSKHAYPYMAISTSQKTRTATHR